MMHRGGGRGRPIRCAAIEDGLRARRRPTSSSSRSWSVDADGQAAGAIRKDGDGIFCFNFRADRMRQMVAGAGPSRDFAGFDRGKAPADGRRDDDRSTTPTFNVPVGFGPMVLDEILARRASSRNGLRHAAHRGDREVRARDLLLQRRRSRSRIPGEERLLVDSQKVATYDLKPEMSAARDHRHPVPRHRGAAPRLHPRQLRQRRHGGAHRQDPGGGHGRRDGGRVPGARGGGGRSARTRRSSSPPTTGTAR